MANTNTNEDEKPQAVVHRTLQAVNTVSSLCGLIVNTITLILALIGTYNRSRSVINLTSSAYVPLIFSIAWTHLEPHAKRRLGAEHRWATVFADTGLFLGFLALLIAGGIIQDGLTWIYFGDRLLLTYNSVPWIVCAIVHLFFIFQASKNTLFSVFYREAPATCHKCRAKLLTASSGRMDEAKYSLLDNQDEDEGVKDYGTERSQHGQSLNSVENV